MSVETIGGEERTFVGKVSLTEQPDLAKLLKRIPPLYRMRGAEELAALLTETP